MKTVRISIILATLALAGMAGTTNGSTLQSAACRVNAAAQALSGGSSVGMCQR
jgi:Tfp pilus assembly protein FimT